MKYKNLLSEGLDLIFHMETPAKVDEDALLMEMYLSDWDFAAHEKEEDSIVFCHKPDDAKKFVVHDRRYHRKMTAKHKEKKVAIASKYGKGNHYTNTGLYPHERSGYKSRSSAGSISKTTYNRKVRRADTDIGNGANYRRHADNFYLW